MNAKPRDIAIATITIFTIPVLIVAHGWYFRNENGIVPHPEGTAVYLQGEACTVNYDKDREVFKSKLDWCLQQYDQEVPSSPPAP